MLRRGLLSLVGLVVLLGVDVPKEPPPPVTLEAAAESTVTGRGVHIENTWDEEAGVYVTFAVMDTTASPQALIDAAVDLQARVAENSVTTGVNIYREEPGVRAGEWTLSIMGSETKFSIIYEHDRSRGWCYYKLDDSRENDILSSVGSYQAYAHGSGSRVVYRGFSDSGKSVPSFVSKWLGNSSLTDQMEGIRKRAEAGAGN